MVVFEPASPAASLPGRSLWRRIAARLATTSSPNALKQCLYSLYGARLQTRLALGTMPRHIGVVLDGNRRFAEMNGYSDPAVAYRLGTEKVDSLLTWCDELDIPIVTVWSLSIENLGRDPKEIQDLIAIVEEKLPRLRDLQQRFNHPRRIRACGRLELLPESLRQAIARTERETEKHGPYQLNIALGYGGREEIVDAVKLVLQEEADRGSSLEEAAQRITTRAIGSHLYLGSAPDPDLIIRTSGEIRLSGFMLWGSVYSEYYFCDALWPAFRKIDLLRAIRSYQERKRRFGH